MYNVQHPTGSKILRIWFHNVSQDNQIYRFKHELFRSLNIIYHNITCRYKVCINLILHLIQKFFNVIENAKSKFQR